MWYDLSQSIGGIRMAFMSDKRKKLLAGAMLEMLEHSNPDIKAEAFLTLKNAVLRTDYAGTPITTKEIVMSLAPFMELAQEHNEKVLAHDLAGCD
jgi:hypothetical protein